MNQFLQHDKDVLPELLEQTLKTATDFLASLETRKVAVSPQQQPKQAALTPTLSLPSEGMGAQQALNTFMSHYGDGLSASAGARYFGFVTGGATPAALAGDWLTSSFDQNATGYGDSVAPLVELETISMLLELFKLPAPDFTGIFVTGATMSNFSALALARQWVGKQRGVNIAQDGLCEPIQVLAGTAHSSVYKSLSMLGMGRSSLKKIVCLESREAIDIKHLEAALKVQTGPCIVVANAGTVNTVDYDDFTAIADLKKRYSFWLHIDAAFGGFAAVSPKTASLVKGWEQADSITIDAHKWLNVPYDSAMMFTRHEALQVEVFQNAAVYLGHPSDEPNFVHRTPENSRRFRALPAWMTLQAYGKTGYCDIVERACDLATQLAEWIEDSDTFELLAPVKMNGLCFTFREAAVAATTTTMEDITTYLAKLRENGSAFLTPTNLHGTPAIRVSISNWRTTQKDIQVAWDSMMKTYRTA